MENINIYYLRCDPLRSPVKALSKELTRESKSLLRVFAEVSCYSPTLRDWDSTSQNYSHSLQKEESNAERHLGDKHCIPVA